MTSKRFFQRPAAATLFASLAWLAAPDAARACSGEFYVVWLEAEASVQVYLRSESADPAGVTDRYGIANVADDTAAGINPNYIHRLLAHAYQNNTKVFVTTDDTDCEISSNGENLGTVSDVQPGN